MLLTQLCVCYTVFCVKYVIHYAHSMQLIRVNVMSLICCLATVVILKAEPKKKSQELNGIHEVILIMELEPLVSY